MNGLMKFFNIELKDLISANSASGLKIIDNDPKDPFDFFNDHYFEQLVAGYHKTTPADGLIIFMPDYSDMK